MSIKILLAVSTYNQLEYTKLCIDSINKLNEENIELDLIIFDDASTDDTVKWCYENNIKVFKKIKGIGLTDSWNEAYKMFKDDKEYKYVIMASNDTLIPQGAIRELVDVTECWPFSVVVPMSTEYGAGHNGKSQGIDVIYNGVDLMFVNNPNNYQAAQDKVLEIKAEIQKNNNLYMLDPHRMKMFNGFFFMMSRQVIEYELSNGNLFDVSKPLYKSEDEFNWASLIPNNDFVALCQTAFVFHFKGVSAKGFTNENFKQMREKLDERNEDDN